MIFLSKNIAFLRKKKNISQQMLASELQLSRSNIASYESGKAEPRAIRLVEIARFFDVSLTQLIEEDLSVLPVDKIRSSNANVQGRLNQLIEKRKETVQAFELKTERLGKVTVGLRALYELKISQLRQPIPELEALIKDFENLLDVMDSLVTSNEEIIAYLKTIDEA